MNIACELRTAGKQRRYAIIGGGFAGVATAWHLLAHASTPISVHLFDGAGIAGGASGAAAGLLHPYSPKGKVCPDPTLHPTARQHAGQYDICSYR